MRGTSVAGSRNREWPSRSWLVVLTGLLAAGPVIVSTVQAINLGWTPSSDDGVIVLRAFDVFSAHSPLLGQYSQTSPLIGTPVYSLGPLLYWVLAVPARIGPVAIVVTMGAISTVAIAGIVFLADRRGGTGLMFLVAVGVVVMFRSLPVEAPYEVWNCWAALLPFTALIFIAWSVACGDFKLLPLLVFVASYVVQCHLTYLVPTVGCLAVAWIGLAGYRRQFPGPGGESHFVPSAQPSMRRWTITATVVVVVSWIAPLLDEVLHRPGNLVLAARLATSGYGSQGSSKGIGALARAVGIPPGWLSPQTPVERLLSSVIAPSALTEASALLVVLGLGMAVVLGRRQKCPEVVRGAAIGLTLSASIAIVARALPSGNLGLAASVYVLTWTSVAGMFVYTVLAWSAWRLVPLTRSTTSLPRAAALLGCSALLVASVLVADRPGSNSASLPPKLGSYESIRTITAEAVDQLAKRRPVLLYVSNTLGQSGLTFQSAVALELRRRGIPFAVSPRLANEMGSQYCPRAVAYPDVIDISEGRLPAPPRAELLARSATVTITLARAPSTVHDEQEALARSQQNEAVPSRCARTTTFPPRS